METLKLKEIEQMTILPLLPLLLGLSWKACFSSKNFLIDQFVFLSFDVMIKLIFLKILFDNICIR